MQLGKHVFIGKSQKRAVTTSILFRTGESPRLYVLSPRHGNHTGDKRADHSFTQRDQGFEKSRDGGRGSRCAAEQVRRARGSGSRSTEAKPLPKVPHLRDSRRVTALLETKCQAAEPADTWMHAR